MKQTIVLAKIMKIGNLKINFPILQLGEEKGNYYH